MRGATIALVLVAIGGLTTACVKQEVASGSANTRSAGVGPSLVVEQFLRAANAKDLARMGQLFGTKDGPISDRDPRQQVEQRMFTIASVLQHDDFEIQGEQLVPGRSGEATSLTVKLTVERRPYPVPFTLVRYKESSWLVEQIGLDAITSPRN